VSEEAVEKMATPARDVQKVRGRGLRTPWANVLTTVMALAVVVATLIMPPTAWVNSSDNAGASSDTPSCSFDNGSLPLVTGITAGSSVSVNCTGEKPNQLVAVAQASLLIGLIPGVSSLFGSTSGDQSKLLSLLKGLPSELAALGEITPGSLHFVTTDSTGALDYTYVVPPFWALDHNASCPPSPQQFAEGVIGCALVLIDVNTVGLLPNGYALLSWESNLLSAVPLAQKPTVAVTPTTAAPGSTVSLSDVDGSTTYWWLATLAYLEGLLSGGAAAPVLSVTVDGQPAITDAAVSPATYSNEMLTPPRLSGTFTVPSGVPPGPQTVTVSLQASLLGVSVPQSASTTLDVS
jgi:hypothetical protein